MPGIHSPISKPLFILDGLVKTSGGSKNLAKGQFTIVSNESTQNGAKIISNFAGISKDTPLKMRVGRFSNARLRSNSAPYYETSYFNLKDVVSIKANFPKFQKQTFDDIIIGYDGINADTAINLAEGQTTVFDIILSGDPIAVGTGKQDYTVKMHFGREVGETNQEAVTRLVNDIKEFTLPFGEKFSNLVNVSVVDSSNIALAGTSYTFSTLSLTDDGTSNALAIVQSQYNYSVVRTARAGQVSEYTILHPTASALAAYSHETFSSYVKDCEDCLAGYADVVGGVVYHIGLEDDGVTQVVAIQALPGAVAGTAVRTGGKEGFGSYSVVLDNKLTQAEITAFLAVSVITGTAEIKYIGEVAEVCSDSTVVTAAWVAGQVCFASSKAYTIQLKDNECGETRLPELQAAYPGLTIIEATPAKVGGCQRVYSTTVVTDVVCNECSNIFLDDFKAEAPQSFEFSEWEAVTPVADANALLGVRLTGKPFLIMPTETTRDIVPFYETSVRIQAFGGYIEEENLNFQPIYSDIFEVTRLSRAQDRDALGYNYLAWEEVSRSHFTGETRHKDNLWANGILGEESVLKFGSQYVTYEVTIDDNKYSQGVGGRSSIGMTFVIFVEFGYQNDVESWLNSLAAKAGVAGVNPTV